MRLIINAIPLLGEESGIGNYTRHIASAVLARPEEFDVTFFYGYASRKLIASTPSQNVSILAHLKNLARKNVYARRAAQKALSLTNRMGNALFPRQWDCYFEPNFVFLPTLKASACIMTLHDFSCFRYPQWHPADRVAHMEKFLWKSVERARLIITAAESIRQEAIRDYGIDPERMVVIPHGVDAEVFQPAEQPRVDWLRRKYNLPPHFILHVGAIEPRKNLSNLIAAHGMLPPGLRARYPLLLIGPKGWKNEEILRDIADAQPHVRLMGHVALEDLPVFYSAADLFVYPSWYEGFGLPVLEAMSCGRPVLVSTASAVKELCGDAACHVAPEDVEGMSKALTELLQDGDLRLQLSQRALIRSRNFSWKQAAGAHMRIFNSC